MARVSEMDGVLLRLDKMIEDREKMVERAELETALVRADLDRLKAAKEALNGAPKVMATVTATVKNGRRRAPAKGKRRARGLASKAEHVIREKGKATAAEVTRALEANSGSVAYALRSLEDKGKIRQTGRMVGRTREYELVGTGTVAEPGSVE